MKDFIKRKCGYPQKIPKNKFAVFSAIADTASYRPATALALKMQLIYGSMKIQKSKESR